MPKHATTSFSKSVLDNARKPEDKPTLTLTDRRLPGFQCIIGARAKTFYYVGYTKGGPVRCKIGHYPSFTVDEARAKAEELKRMFDKGYDPKKFKGRHVEGVLEEYIEARQSRGKLKDETADEYRRLLGTTCKRWKTRDADSVTDEEIERFTDELNKRGQPATANHALTLMGVVRKQLKLPSPRVSRYEIGKRKLGVIDWAAWYSAVAAQTATMRNLHLFGVYTGIRKEACSMLRWEQINNDRTIHFAKLKKNEDVTLPYCDRVAAILDEQRVHASEWVFPSNKNPENHIVETRFEGQIGTFHDLRRMFTVAGRACLLPDYVISKLRADSDSNMRDWYDSSIAPHEWTEKISSELDKRFNR